MRRNAKLILFSVSHPVILSIHERANSQKSEKGANSDSAALHDPAVQHSVLSLIPFDDDEGNEEDAEADKGPNDFRAVPGFRDASPLHCKNVAGYSAKHQDHADDVHFDQHLPPAWTALRGLLHKEEEND